MLTLSNFSYYLVIFIYLFNFSICTPSDASYTYEINQEKYHSLLKTIVGNSTSTAIQGNLTYIRAPKHAVIDNRYILSFDENCSLLPSLGKNMHEVLSFLSCSMKYEYSTSFHGCHISYEPTPSNPNLPLDLLRELPCLKYVEEIQVMKTAQIQSTVPWGLDRIDQATSQLNQKYQFNLSGKNTHVYVIDSGIDMLHPEFKGRAELLYTVSSLGEDVRRNSTDCSGHGTHVSGIIAGNAVGVAKEAIIHAIRVLGCSDSTNADVIEAIDYVIRVHKKPAVINMSLGAIPDPVTGEYKPIPSLDDAVKRAIDAGITVVVAAGNYNINACSGSPTTVPSLIVVGSSTLNPNGQDIKSSFSNYGSCVDIFAPGTNIVSSFPGGKYIPLSGSSQASPHVTGVVAQILEFFPNFLPSDVEKMLLSISTKDAVSTPAGTPSSLLRSFNNKNLPMDSFITNISSYSDLLQYFLNPSPTRMSTSVIILIVLFSFLGLLFIFYVFFKVVRHVSRPKDSSVANIKDLRNVQKSRERTKANSISPVVSVSKTKKASVSQSQTSIEKPNLTYAPSSRIPVRVSKSRVISEPREKLSTRSPVIPPAYLNKAAVVSQAANSAYTSFASESRRESTFSADESNGSFPSETREEASLSVILSYQDKTFNRDAPPPLPPSPPSFLFYKTPIPSLMYSSSDSDPNRRSSLPSEYALPSRPPFSPTASLANTFSTRPFSSYIETGNQEPLLSSPTLEESVNLNLRSSSFASSVETDQVEDQVPPISTHDDAKASTVPLDSTPSSTKTGNPSVRMTFSLLPRLTTLSNPYDISEFLGDLKP